MKQEAALMGAVEELRAADKELAQAEAALTQTRARLQPKIDRLLLQVPELHSGGSSGGGGRASPGGGASTPPPPSPPMGAPLSSAAVEQVQKVFALNNLLTPIMTQSYTPLVPLFATEALGMSVYTLGLVFGTLTACSLVSFLAIQPLLQRYPVKTIMLADYGVRAASALCYLASIGFGSTPFRVFFLFASRLLYGLTLHSFALPAIWVGVRVDEGSRAGAVAYLTGLVAIGISLGPILGSVVAGVMPTPEVGYAVPGVITFLGSALLSALLLGIDDGGMLPSAPAAAAAGGNGGASSMALSAAEVEAAWQKKQHFSTVARCLSVSIVCVCIGPLSGFEGLMSLQMKDGYGWGTREAMPIWLLLGILTVVGSLSLPKLIQFFNWAQLSLLLAAVGTVGVAAINFGDLTTLVSPARYALTLISIMSGSMVYAMHLALLTERCPPELQVEYSAFIQMLGQAGRAIGPLLATTVYGFANDALPGSAPNAAILYNMVGFGVAIGYPLAYFAPMYGSCEDLSLAQRKALARKAASDKEVLC